MLWKAVLEFIAVDDDTCSVTVKFRELHYVRGFLFGLNLM